MTRSQSTNPYPMLQWGDVKDAHTVGKNMFHTLRCTDHHLLP